MNNLSHNSYDEELIISFLCGEIDDAKNFEFKQKLNNDTSFKNLYNELKSTWDLSSISLMDIESDWNSIQKRISTKSSGLSMWGYISRIAAVLVVMLSVSVGLWVYWNVPGYGRWVVFETNAHSDSVVLPDQSVVFLNHHSSLKYPNSFSKNSRDVSLSGEGFFEIESDKNRPFTISIANVEIKVLGTSFNVFENQKDKSVELNVVDGTVSFNNKVQSLLISKGESAVANNNQIVKNATTNNNFLSWKTGKLEFNSSSLNEIVNSISRHYSDITSFEIDTESDILVTTKFDNLSLDNVLEELEIHFQKNFALKNGKLVISD